LLFVLLFELLFVVLLVVLPFDPLDPLSTLELISPPLPLASVLSHEANNTPPQTVIKVNNMPKIIFFLRSIFRLL
jgi:hypothetical protein